MKMPVLNGISITTKTSKTNTITISDWVDAVRFQHWCQAYLEKSCNIFYIVN